MHCVSFGAPFAGALTSPMDDCNHLIRKYKISSANGLMGNADCLIVRCIEAGLACAPSRQTGPPPTRPHARPPQAGVFPRSRNPRLYDPPASRHVTLEDLRRLIAAGERVQV